MNKISELLTAEVRTDVQKKEKITKKGKCPVCKSETTYSKIYGFYCGCQGLGGTEEYDTESGY